MEKPDKKCILLASRIGQYIEQGIGLSKDVLHFMESTFSISTPGELARFLDDEFESERDLLLRLLVSPDESMQVHIEDLLLEETYDEKDVETISDLLCSRKIKTHVLFPGEHEKPQIVVPDDAILPMVTQLHISWKPDPGVMGALDAITDTDLKKSVTIGMRNRRLKHSEIKTKILREFLGKSDVKHGSFLDCLDFLLDMMELLKAGDDFYTVLSLRKEHYSELIRKKESFEHLLEHSNLETVSLQGIHGPSIDMDALRRRIEMIDRITLAVYGKIVYCI